MKVKFTKLAALLLAGAALFVSGCTDYEVDIQNANKRIDQMNSEKASVAELNNQVASLTSMINTLKTDLSGDIKKVSDDLAALTSLHNQLKSDFDAAVTSMNQEIANLKTADQNLQKSINELTTKYQELQDNKADKTELEKVKTDLTALIAAEENRAKAKEKEMQDAIDNINNKIIPAINAQIEDLQKNKADKADFDAFVTKTNATIEVMQAAIGELGKLKTESKTSLVDAINEVLAKLDDYVLTTTFEKFAAIVGTEEELKNMQGTIIGAVTELQTLTAGFPEGSTIKDYIDIKISTLQGQLDLITNEEGTGRLDQAEEKIAGLRTDVNKCLAQLQFVEDYEGGLKAYIDDAAADALEQAMAYTDEWCNELYDWAYDLFYEIYYTWLPRVLNALQRVQSVQFVPEYDDLKITTNMAFVTLGQNAIAMDQPTKVTYQILPAQYTKDVVEGIEEFVTDPSYLRIMFYIYGLYDGELYTEDGELDPYFSTPFTREELKEYGINGILPFFDVKSVETRADGAEVADPKFIITGVDKYDTTTGEITFIVLPVNVATAQFAANGLKPNYEMSLVSDDNYLVGAEYYWPYGNVVTGTFDQTNRNPFLSTLKVGVWEADAYDAFQARSAFAAQLRLYAFQDYDAEEDYDWDNMDEEAWYNDPDYWPDIITIYTDYENELASPYNVLYPKISLFNVLGEPYKPAVDEEGKPKVDEDGYAYMVRSMSEHQDLPYSALRENPVGEKPSQDPKGYRVILNNAVPVVSVNGSRPMNFEDAADKYMIVLPEFDIEFTGFEYSQGGSWFPLVKERYVETEQVYAEIEMNPEKSAAERKLAIGNVVTGNYTFSNDALGSFDAHGRVFITKPQGEVKATAHAEWTYSLDADVDHNRFYETDGTTDYSRASLAIELDEEDSRVIREDLFVFRNEFFAWGRSIQNTITAQVANEEGELEDVELSISNIRMDQEGKITADISGFEWDQVYYISAAYELAEAIVTVNVTFTTVDRNRETIEVTVPTYEVTLNGKDYNADSDTYTSAKSDISDDLFDAFVANGIINQGDPKDFKDNKAFVGTDNNGKEGHLVLDEENESSDFLFFDDDNVWMTIDSENLKKVTDAEETQVLYVTTYIGQLVKVSKDVVVNLPVFDYLHLRYYTFNTQNEHADFIQKYDFADNDGSIVWWTQVQPSYFTGDYNAQQEKISFRHALADYDVAYINLAELAFNVVDKNDVALSDEEIAKNHIVARFIYTDPKQGDKALPAADKVADKYLLYKSLWVDNTTFYYRTNEKKFIPALGYLAIQSGQTEFPLETRFTTPKASVAYPDEVLDYSKYAMVRWTPFGEPKAAGFTITLDENKVYRVSLFKGMELKDNRPQGVSYYVIKDGEWVKGNVTSYSVDAGTYTSNGNGYKSGVYANAAYHITTQFTYDELSLPNELKKLLSIKYSEDGVNFVDENNADKSLTPYVVFDYTSEVEFRGTVTVPVVVVLDNPWQEPLTFKYDFVIKGMID